MFFDSLFVKYASFFKGIFLDFLCRVNTFRENRAAGAGFQIYIVTLTTKKTNLI